MKKLILIMAMILPLMAGATDLETIKAEWSKKVIDNVPTAGIGIMLERFDMTWPTGAVGDVCQVMQMGVPKKVLDDDDGYTVEVDAKNGYVESHTEGSDRQTMSACVWRRTDGHRLFAVVISQPVDPAMEIVCFYDYDPQKHILTPEPEIIDNILPLFPTEYMSFVLPRTGKDFIVSEYSSGYTYNRIYKWDGMVPVYDRTEKEALDTEGDGDHCDEDADVEENCGIKAIRGIWAEGMEHGGGRLRVELADIKENINRYAVAFCSTFPETRTNKQLRNYFLFPDEFEKDLYVVDSKPRNGYVRCEMTTELAPYTEVCYWNRKNGHKLVAVYMEDNYENESENDRMVVFYDVDPAADMMTAEPALTRMIEERVKGYDDYSVKLPKEGKDIEVIGYVIDKEADSADLTSMKLVWNGTTFAWAAGKGTKQ